MRSGFGCGDAGQIPAARRRLGEDVGAGREVDQRNAVGEGRIGVVIQSERACGAIWSGVREHEVLAIIGQGILGNRDLAFRHDCSRIDLQCTATADGRARTGLVVQTLILNVGLQGRAAETRCTFSRCRRGRSVCDVERIPALGKRQTPIEFDINFLSGRVVTVIWGESNEDVALGEIAVGEIVRGTDQRDIGSNRCNDPATRRVDGGCCAGALRWRHRQGAFACIVWGKADEAAVIAGTIAIGMIVDDEEIIRLSFDNIVDRVVVGDRIAFSIRGIGVLERAIDPIVVAGIQVGKMLVVGLDCVGEACRGGAIISRAEPLIGPPVCHREIDGSVQRVRDRLVVGNGPCRGDRAVTGSIKITFPTVPNGEGRICIDLGVVAGIGRIVGK